MTEQLEKKVQPCEFAKKYTEYEDCLYTCTYKKRCDFQTPYGLYIKFCKKELNGKTI